MSSRANLRSTRRDQNILLYKEMFPALPQKEEEKKKPISWSKSVGNNTETVHTPPPIEIDTWAERTKTSSMSTSQDSPSSNEESSEEKPDATVPLFLPRPLSLYQSYLTSSDHYRFRREYQEELQWLYNELVLPFCLKNGARIITFERFCELGYLQTDI